MKKLSLVCALCAALLFGIVPTFAYALPGQSSAQLAAWMKSNAALHGVKKTTEEMSGLPQYQASYKVSSFGGTFTATMGEKDNVLYETLGLDGVPDNYDILKHSATSAAIVSGVYGANVAGDFASAKKLGTWTEKDETSPTTLWRGSTYGYEAAHAFVKLLPLSAVDAEAQRLATCVKSDCGD